MPGHEKDDSFFYKRPPGSLVAARAFLGTNPADEPMTFGLSIIWTKSAGDADYAFSVERSSKNSR